MIVLLAANLLLVALAVMLPNEVLTWHSWVLYGAQMILVFPYLARRSFFARNLFLPTTFALGYSLVNLTLGSFLVPHDIGWNKDYVTVARLISSYNVIVPYLLLANIVLFLLSCRTLATLAETDAPPPGPEDKGLGPVTELALLIGFLAVTLVNPYSAFAFQLAILILHLSEVARYRTVRRFAVYALYLLILVAFSFENKREIVMVLFLILFLEADAGRYRLGMTPRTLLGGLAVACCFLGLVLTASVLRGYGDLEVSSLTAALKAVPRYIRSDLFVDGLTDNLELNYSYGSAIASIHLVLDQSIPYQFGASLWKVLFLPLPREIFAWKPDNVMTIFTRVFAPAMAAEGGSLPVPFSSEMFVNFAYAGLLPFALVWIAVNRAFVAFHTSASRSFRRYSTTFLIVTVLIFTRGGGLEQYLLYYLLGAPILFLGERAWVPRVHVAVAGPPHSTLAPPLP